MKRNNRGVSLVEVLMAMVILLFVSLALMQTALMGIDSNMQNVLRDEAVGIAGAEMEEARNVPFGTLAAGVTNATVNRDLRKISGFPFDVTRTVTDLNTDNKRVQIQVDWQWKQEPYSHTIWTIVRNQ